MINNHYSDIQLVQDYTKVIEYQQIVFDTEKELVQFFYKLINEKLHSIAFWNGNRFDVPYLWNRCPKIGVDIASGSPTGEISHFNYWPKHRYVFDYMEIVAKWGWDIPDLSSTALDHISSQVVGTGKFKYDGNLIWTITFKDCYLESISSQDMDYANDSEVVKWTASFKYNDILEERII
jgi:DNA polymerase elongation subunit (family B)